MTIWRYTADGMVSYNLTVDEMRDAYWEQQHEFDMEYIANGLIDLFNETGEYDEMQKKLESNPQFLKRVAYRYRKYLEDLYSCDDEFECLKDAVRYCSEAERMSA